MRYWESLPTDQRGSFRFHHVSTDEVYGDLDGTDNLFTPRRHPTLQVPRTRRPKPGRITSSGPGGRTVLSPRSSLTNCSRQLWALSFPLRSRSRTHIILNA